MALSLSPDIQVNEKEVASRVSFEGTTPTGFCGGFRWGPVDKIVTVADTNELVSVFGEPDANTFEYFYSAWNYLQYGSNLRVVRAATSNAANAAVSGDIFGYKESDPSGSSESSQSRRYTSNQESG